MRLLEEIINNEIQKIAYNNPNTCNTCKALALFLDSDSLYFDEDEIVVDYFQTR